MSDPGAATPPCSGMLARAWASLLAAGVRALAACIVPRRPAPMPQQPGDGPVVVVVPVLPDLSHTFVYREVQALRRQRPDWRLVVLAANDRAPVHAEAAALRPHVHYLQRDGITRAALRACRWLLTRRGRELFALYRDQGELGALLGKHPLRDPRHPGNAFVLADQLAPLRPRHVHVYASTWPANVVMGAATLLGVPFSISSYVDFEFAYAHALLATKVERARFFRVVTAHCRERLLALPQAGATPATRVPVVLLGLDLANWQQRAAPRGDGTIVSAARLVAKKGLHLLPPALAQLRARGIACRWRVVGDGPERARLEQLCREQRVDDLVTFLGPRDNAAVKQELLTADLAVLPCVIADDGERDGIPIFLCEAMALGVPVVSTPISGIPELVRDGDTGFLAAAGDVQDLAATLARALTDRQATAAIAARGREAVHRELDVDRLAGQLIAEIER